jgi:dethiobiotin synthetase
VDIKLGCINHALLTANAIKQKGLQIFAWVANSTQIENEYTHPNIETLKIQLLNKFDALFLGHIPFQQDMVSQQIYPLDYLLTISRKLQLE